MNVWHFQAVKLAVEAFKRERGRLPSRIILGAKQRAQMDAWIPKIFRRLNWDDPEYRSCFTEAAYDPTLFGIRVDWSKAEDEIRMDERTPEDFQREKRESKDREREQEYKAMMRRLSTP